jgi:ADP-heptose:LPS heptosyltransferase
MDQKILVIIGGRGIGDLIYHLPLLNSLYASYKSKLLILSNNINQSKEVFKNENFYKKIIEFDNNRYSILKTIKKIVKFKNLINSFKADQVILTSNTTRLTVPVLLCNIKNKIIFGTGKFLVNKDNTLKNLSVSEKLINYTNDLNLPVQKKDFFLNQDFIDLDFKKKDKNIFINLDSHHDQNNWGINNFIKIIKDLEINEKKNIC